MIKSKRRRQKLFAGLAAGLTLGVGAVATLAVWTDHEFATGSFSTGQFNLVGNPTSATATYTDHATADAAAALTFTMPQAENLAPGDVVHGSYWVRLAENTTSPADLTMAVSTGGDLSLPWTVHAIAPTAACNASVTGNANYQGTGFGDAATGPAGKVRLTPGASGAAGTAVQLCFTITAPADVQQGQASTATWDITATSVE